MLPCAHFVIFESEEDLRGNTARLVEWEYRVVPGHRNRFLDPGSKF
jgi:hypothetical protein